MKKREVEKPCGPVFESFWTTNFDELILIRENGANGEEGERGEDGVESDSSISLMVMVVWMTQIYRISYSWNSVLNRRTYCIP